jgi:L-histidine Nalpha-methyltransferase
MTTSTLLPQHLAELVVDVRAGLTHPSQKELHSKYFYDELGSALFESITLLPEYGLTRAESRILRKYSRDIICRLSTPLQIAELGSGSGKKTRYLLEAAAFRQPTNYFPIEISPAALVSCKNELQQLNGITVHGFQRTYLDGLRAVTAQLPPGDRLLVLFLGSSIGNFELGPGEDFLREVRRTLRSGDALLLGADIVKDIPVQLLAYNDPTGVTAAFNLNILARLNRELGANFDLTAFSHDSRWNPEFRRIEMHLVSRWPQQVAIPGADLEINFALGESVWTESSHKYRISDLPQLAVRTGFQPVAQWQDQEWPFTDNLWQAT